MVAAGVGAALYVANRASASFARAMNPVGQGMLLVIPTLFTFVLLADRKLNHCARHAHEAARAHPT